MDFRLRGQKLRFIKCQEFVTSVSEVPLPPLLHLPFSRPMPEAESLLTWLEERGFQTQSLYPFKSED